MPRIAIEVKGGCVCRVCTEDETEIEIVIVDHDTNDGEIDGPEYAYVTPEFDPDMVANAFIV